jgi:hypothetical protein
MTWKSKLVVALGAAMLSLSAAPLSAQVTWNWSFGSESGQFITSGSAPGGVAAPGTYNLLDFIVNPGSSGTAGSMSGGQYFGGDFGTTLPYDMVWNGSAVTQWVSAGSNNFDWWVFDEAITNSYYFFGWETNNINNPDHASYFDGSAGCCGQPSSPVTVAVATSAVPEPATVGLVALGLGVLGFAGRRRSRADATA